MDEEKKNISTYILEIHSDIQQLKAYYQNMDNTIKILLSKFNNFNNLPSAQNITTKPVNTNPENTSLSEKKTPTADESETNRTPISQQIFFNQIPLSLASVEIFDSKNNLIKQSRTNSKGKLISSLIPGTYNIHVKKNVNNEFKVPVEARFSIEISASKKVLELEPYTIS